MNHRDGNARVIAPTSTTSPRQPASRVATRVSPSATTARIGNGTPKNADWAIGSWIRR